MADTTRASESPVQMHEARSADGPNKSSKVSLLVRLWQWLPVVVRAVLVGLSVSLIGALGTGIPMQVNLKVFPNLPWSLPLAAVWLWLFWRYLDGRGWPRSSSSRRRELLRARPLSAAVWRWSLLTCGLLFAFNIAFQSAYSRFLPISVRLPEALLALPPVTLLFVLLILSAQAGIVEEAAFRGYMFTPIEHRHGPVVATLIVSLAFVAAHFNNPQNLSVYRILNVFLVGVIYCALVVVTRSILPGLVVHAVGDAIGLLLLWRAAMRGGAAMPRLSSLSEALTDSTFLTFGSVALLSGLGAIWSFVRLRQVARSEILQPKGNGTV